MSLAEIFAKAITNTILGMGVVFTILIFIAFIISLFKYLPGLIAQFNKKQTPKNELAVEDAGIVLEKNLAVDEGVIVAVITAAIKASLNENEPSSETYFVRSIRRI